MRAAVLGSPVSHSLSPVLHRAAYDALGLTGWDYRAIECDEAGLAGFLAGCGPEWAGLSLTMPLKRVVLPLLGQTDPVATRVGAANTVVFSGGTLDGYNTDVPGMVAAITEAVGERAAPPETALAGPVLILGAGATACSALGAAHALGAREVTVAVRDHARAADLLATAERLGVVVTLTGFGDPASANVLISTVPGSGADAYAGLLTSGEMRPRLLFDVVYHPWPTPLASAAERTGAIVVNGFGLLLHQAAAQVTLMTGKPAPLEPMRKAGLAALGAPS